MIYLACFLVSCSILLLLERCRTDKYTYWVIVVFSLSITAALAGVRDYTIGTDVGEYGNEAFYYATRCRSLLQCIQRSTLESGYMALNYAVSRFTSSPHWFYFFVAFVMNLFAYLGLYKYNQMNQDSKISISLGMMVYYLVFYNQGLNILRQSLAVSVVIFGMPFLMKKRYFKYALICVLATLFHTSAFMALFFIPIYSYIEKGDKLKNYVIIIVIVSVLVSVYGSIAEALMNMGIIPEKYVRYVADSAGYKFKWDSLVVRLPVIIISIVVYKYLVGYNRSNKMLFLAMLLEVVFMQLAAFTEFASRVNIYVMGFRVFLFGAICASVVKAMPASQKKWLYCNLINLFTYSYNIIIWVYSIIIQNNNRTYPYTSEILKIFKR